MEAFIGYSSIFLAFVTGCVLWLVLYVQKNQKPPAIAKAIAWIHLSAVVVIMACLYVLIFTNQFQYHYVWHHSSLELPLHFKISCLWEGQEGSFLLWIFWDALLILLLLHQNDKLSRGALLYFIPIQLFLLTMIMGVPVLGLEIGASPFVLLKETIQSQVYNIQPDFVPTDGTGMNALLQNYWMVIHPPVIFLGFAISGVPFSFCLYGLSGDGLQKGEWVKPIFPWVVISVFSIGLGMMMGAYWAYETLNFGGFWNWDPVENAIFVPWIILMAALHLVIIYNRKQKALGITAVLIVASFLLVVYSTFLTRSGILGDSSVHAFTDLGMSGQLLAFLLFFVLVSLVVILKSKVWVSDVLNPKRVDDSVGSFEFWMYVGVLFFMLSAFQVLLPTSFPVINRLGLVLGLEFNLAPPADQVSFYSDIQIWFVLSVLILMVVAQAFYWNKKTEKAWMDLVFGPVLLTTLFSILYLYLWPSNHWKYILAFVVIVFSTLINIQLLVSRYSSIKSSAGGFSHIGFGLMILGILISQGHQKLLTAEHQFEHELNRAGNVLLVKDKPSKFNAYEVTYEESYYKTKDGERIDKSFLEPSFNPQELVFNHAYETSKKVYARGDKIQLDQENIYYQVRFTSDQEQFVINPRIQLNPAMGVVASPDIDQRLLGDIYTHVSNFPDPEKKQDWSKSAQINLKVGDHYLIGSRILRLQEVTSTPHTDGNGVSLGAIVHLISKGRVDTLNPVLILTEAGPQVVTDQVNGKGFNLLFHGVDKASGEFGFAFLSTPSDWITIKSIYFPMMNLVWFGAILILFGLSISCINSILTKRSQKNTTKVGLKIVRAAELKQFILNFKRL